jgi:hypothetical protein
MGPVTSRAATSHPLIPHESSPIPSWVNSSTQTLFSQTIEKAQNGTLTNIYDFWGNLQPQPYRTWAANMVAQDTWRTSTSLYDKGRNGSFTGYANLGFHPFGDFPGTWLTQIIGQVAIASDNEWRLRNDTEMWTSIVKINDTSPCCKDLFCNSSIITPSPLVKDCLLDDRTDTDMILHGFENDCRWATQVPKPSPRHFDCPDLGRVKTKQELDAENRAGMWDCVQATPTTLARSEAAKRFRNMELSVKSIIVSGYIGLLLWVYG